MEIVGESQSHKSLKQSSFKHLITKMSYDYFEADSHVSTYNKFRPSPPEALVKRIVDFATEKILDPLNLAIDVGCGSGQSTEVLGPYFKKVLGIDSSPQIINEAKKNCKLSNITYSTSSAEKMNVDNSTADVITVGQALHWLDVTKFYSEAERILRPKGVLAVYGYHLPMPVFNGNEKVEKLIEKYYKDVLSDYTLPQSRKVYLENYTTTEFNEVPFVEGGKMIREEDFILETEGNISNIVGYITSWSAYQNFVKQTGEENGQKLLKDFENEFKSALKPSEYYLENFKIKFKYFLLMGRKE